MHTEDDEIHAFKPEIVPEVPEPKNKGGRPKKAAKPTTTGELPTPRAAMDPAVIKALDVLSADEIAQIEREALAEVEADLKKAKKTELRAQFVKEFKQRLDPKTNEEQVTFILDIAEYGDRVLLDGRYYFHGRRYTVARSVYDVLMETMWRTHEHQRVVDGKSILDGQRNRLRESLPGSIINGATGAISNAPARNDRNLTAR